MLSIKKVIAICDQNRDYARRLAEFANCRQDLPFEMVVFTEPNRLAEYATSHNLVCCLMDEFIKAPTGIPIIWLTDRTIEKEEKDFCIFRYQPADELLRQAAAGCIEMGERVHLVGHKSRVLGVYSPVHHTGATSFCLILTRLLSEWGKALYLNLEDCSGLRSLFEQNPSSDLSDLIYYLSQDLLDALRLRQSVFRWSGIDYIPSVKHPEDLESISSRLLIKLLNAVVQEGGYETLVVDFGLYGRELWELLDCCDRIYMPILEDPISEGKIREWEQHLTDSGNQVLSGKIEKIRLPEGAVKRNYSMENLLESSLGSFTKELLKGWKR